MREAHLILVSSEGNHNKYYNMVPEPGGQWKAEYGRIGAEPMMTWYPSSAWDGKYREKIRKGYVEQSDLVNAAPTDSLSGIADPAVQELVKTLLTAARGYVKKNYASLEVSAEAVRSARLIVSALVEEASVSAVNEALVRLFETVPRSMRNVQDALVKEMSDVPKVIERETSLLDALEGQITTVGTEAAPGEDILTANGLDIRIATADEEAMLRRMMGSSADKAVKFFAVENAETTERFEGWCHDNGATEKDRYLLFHGSILENWWNIVLVGLDPSYAAWGMFGKGLYFANSARKSLRYILSSAVSLPGARDTGYLAVFEVADKNPLHISTWNPWCGNIDLSTIEAKHRDAVFAHRGDSLVNNEFIVYRREQANLRYLIEVRN